MLLTFQRAIASRRSEPFNTGDIPAYQGPELLVYLGRLGQAAQDFIKETTEHVEHKADAYAKSRTFIESSGVLRLAWRSMPCTNMIMFGQCSLLSVVLYSALRPSLARPSCVRISLYLLVRINGKGRRVR